MRRFPLIILLVMSACGGDKTNSTTDADSPRTAPSSLHADTDRDGFPDVAELRSPADRQAFRAWFTAVAEAQYFAPDQSWDPINRDCAGLVRYAYVEALKRHDAAWLSSRPALTDPGVADVSVFNYPDVPVLGANLFRSHAGNFEVGDLDDSTFHASASTAVLRRDNCVFVSRDPALAKPGDLLFFHHRANPRMPDHVMIVLRGGRVAYHTGPDGSDPGVVKLMLLSDLSDHPDGSWHARADNPSYLGVYRLKILD